MKRAYEALPQTPPGGKPPETPAPFPWDLNGTERQRFVKGSQAGEDAALDKSLPLRRGHYEEGKGASMDRALRMSLPLVGGDRSAWPRNWRRARWRAYEALPQTPPGGRPPETPRFCLTRPAFSWKPRP